MPKMLRIKRATPGKFVPVTQPHTLVGKTVRYRLGSGDSAVDVIGYVREVKGGTATVAPTIPNAEGILYVCKDVSFHIPTDLLDAFDVTVRADRDVKAFETRDPLESVKAAQEVRADGVIVDYQNVRFDGFASTFAHVTPEDRDGDYIVVGAFDKTMKQFMENPVMLTDHTRSVKNLMGHYDKITITGRGLAMQGVVTNSTHPDAVHVRFQLMEKSLKTLSIGGFFYYMEDYKGIEQVDLHETSLVVIPANPDATFNVHSISDDIVAKAFQRHRSLNGGELRQSQKSILARKEPISLTAPSFMAASAERGLKLHEEGYSGDGLKPATVADARKMAQGEALSEDKWRRIAPWIARHIGDLDAVDGDEITPGLVAMLLWGGGASKESAKRAQSYAERLVERIDESMAHHPEDSEEKLEPLKDDVA
jgi:HK97 family phage prohead protease